MHSPTAPIAATTASGAHASDAPRDICRAVLESKSSDLVVLSLPGTSYQLHFRPVGSIRAEVGKRITGRVRGSALRLHVAQAGGKFIEPVYGHPRIVQGTVLAHGADQRTILVDMALPAWLTLESDQRADEFPVGTMVNMYVASGMTFEEV